MATQKVRISQAFWMLHGLQVTGLPEYFVVFFFQDGPVFYAFDYQNGIEQEPSIRLIDVEMDQWLEVENSFDDFSLSARGNYRRHNV